MIETMPVHSSSLYTAYVRSAQWSNPLLAGVSSASYKAYLSLLNCTDYSEASLYGSLGKWMDAELKRIIMAHANRQLTNKENINIQKNNKKILISGCHLHIYR